MDTLLSAAHCRRELGEKLFEALMSSDNTAELRALAQRLVNKAPPTEITLKGVTYEIPHCLEGEDPYVNGETFVVRAEKMSGAALGEDDCCNLLEYQGDIHVRLRNKVTFVFTKFRNPIDPKQVAVVYWLTNRWAQGWDSLEDNFRGHKRILRRK